MNQQEQQLSLNPHLVPLDNPSPYHQNTPERESPRSSCSRSRSKSKSHPRQPEENQLRQIESIELSKNEEPIKNSNEGSQESGGKQKPKLKKGSSKVVNTIRQVKKKRPNKLYITDFSSFLPEALIYINRTNLVTKIRIGDRYQVQVPSAPPLVSFYRPMEQWLIWPGASNPQEKPTQQHIKRFKETLGGNRNEEDLIAMRNRLGMCEWNRVVEWAESRRTELRWTFHQNHRNRTS